MIYAMEGGNISTDDILGDFVQTDYKKGNVNKKMEGAMVNLLEEIDTSWYKWFIYLDSRGKKCMYAKSKKAIYSNLEA